MIMAENSVREFTVPERGQLRLKGLSWPEISFLRRLEGESKLSLRLGEGEGDILVLATMHCGVVQAGSARIFIEPKVPVRNLLYLVESTYALPNVSFYDQANFARGRNFLEFLLHFFYSKVDQLVSGGLYRSYVPVTENVSLVRGRIDIPRTIMENFARPHRIVSEHDDYTDDVVENKIVRYTLERTRNLATSEGLKRKLVKLLASFSDVENPAALPQNIFERLVYHRLNEHYKPVHELCRVLLTGIAIDIPAGPIGFRSFLVNMEQLFQEFLFATLKRSPHLADYQVVRQSGSRIVWLRGTAERRDIHVVPDVRVRNAADVLVVDAKYKRPLMGRAGRWIPVSPDVYQMMAYCVVHQCDGALVYPKVETPEADLDEIYEVRGSDSLFKLKTLNLAEPLDGLKSTCEELCANLRDFFERSHASVDTRSLLA